MSEEQTQEQEPQVEEYTVEQKLEILAANVMGLLELCHQLHSRLADVESFLSAEEEDQQVQVELQSGADNVSH